MGMSITNPNVSDVFVGFNNQANNHTTQKTIRGIINQIIYFHLPILLSFENHRAIIKKNFTLSGILNLLGNNLLFFFFFSIHSQQYLHFFAQS
jgi:hypothetical protein